MFLRVFAECGWNNKHKLFLKFLRAENFLLMYRIYFELFSLLYSLVEFTRSTSQVRVTSRVRVRLKSNCVFLKFVLISFDCDSCFHNDVPVVNSTDY